MAEISVIMPVYNTKPEYINEALDSLYNQTFQDFEIIIIDDGSNDNQTKEYLSKLEGVSVIIQEHIGPGGARNKGLEIAKGNYISFLDSDDCLDKNFLSTLYNIAEKNNSDIACGTLRLNVNGNFYIYENYENKTTNSFQEKINLVNNGSCSSKIFKKEIVKNLRFPENLLYEDNYFLVAALLKSNNVSYSNTAFYNYRSNPTSITRNCDKKHINKVNNDKIKILYELKKLTEKYNKEYQNSTINVFSEILLNINMYRDKKLKKDIKKISPEHAKAFEQQIKNERLKNFQTNLAKIFSIKNQKHKNRKYKVITVLGIQLKINTGKIVNRKDGFSVIIPTMLKTEKILKETLKTLENDILVNEIIVINNSKEKFEFDSKKIKILNMKNNIFVNPAWNLGIRASESKYFCLLNDDIVLPEGLFSQVYDFLKNNDEAGIIGLGPSSFTNIDADKNFEKPINKKLNFEKFGNPLFLNSFGAIMFGEHSKYFKIPKQIKIYCGDNFLIRENFLHGYQNYTFENGNLLHATSTTSNDASFEKRKFKDLLFYSKTDPRYFNLIPKKYRLNFFEKIFSVINDGNYKIITICGMKITTKKHPK